MKITFALILFVTAPIAVSSAASFPVWLDSPGVIDPAMTVVGLNKDAVWYCNPSQLYSFNPATGISTKAATRSPAYTGGWLWFLAEGPVVGFQWNSGTPATGRIHYSQTGYDYWAENALVFSPAYGTPESLPRSIIDMGSGRLLFTEYGGTPTMRLWYSNNYGLNWGRNYPDFNDSMPLITTGYFTITHFHGGTFDKDYNKLYLFTGDADKQSAILRCDNVFGEGGLILDPNTWRDKLGLGTANRLTPDPCCCVNDNLVNGSPGSQKFRTLDILFDGQYGYWVTDSSGQNLKAYKFHRAYGDITPVDPNYTITGSGWIWAKTKTGHKVFLTGSEYLYTAYRVNHDEYVHLYAVSNNDKIIELKKWRRWDANSPVTKTSVVPFRAAEIGDYFVWSTTSRAIGPEKARAVAGMIVNKMTVENDNYVIGANSISNKLDILENDTPPYQDTLTIELAAPAFHGQASIEGGFAYYTPEPNYTGEDSFTYTAVSGAGERLNATVTLQIPDYNITEYLPLTEQVLWNYEGTFDDNPVTYTIDNTGFSVLPDQAQNWELRHFLNGNYTESVFYQLDSAGLSQSMNRWRNSEKFIIEAFDNPVRLSNLKFFPGLKTHTVSNVLASDETGIIWSELVDSNSSVLPAENISINGRNYETIKLDYTFHFSEPNRTVTATLWLAKNIGIVKQHKIETTYFTATPVTHVYDLNLISCAKVRMESPDLANFMSYWLSSQCHAPDWCQATDLDRNFVVDITDLSIFAQYWLN